MNYIKREVLGQMNVGSALFMGRPPRVPLRVWAHRWACAADGVQAKTGHHWAVNIHRARNGIWIWRAKSRTQLKSNPAYKVFLDVIKKPRKDLPVDEWD
jgi:hypothetical protein